jgi:Domain of unknown function (DUF4160)
MPTISAFYGITIRMYHRDHEPAHFQLFYQGNEAKIDIEKLQLTAGHLPRRALGLRSTGRSCTRTSFEPHWTLAQQRRTISNIEPLE